MTIEYAENFEFNRNSATGVSSPLSYGGVGGGGASIVACPSGFGYALHKDTSVANDHRTTRTIASPRNNAGFSGIWTFNGPSSYSSWVLLFLLVQTATNNRFQIEYQPSTNTFRATINLLAAINGGTTWSGPADPTQPTNIAVEYVRNTTTGQLRVWMDGVQVVNLSSINTGDGTHLFNNETLYAPNYGASGAGYTTASNWISWDTTLHTHDGDARVVQTLEPVSDIAATWLLNSPPHFSRLAAQTGIGSSNADINEHGITALAGGPTKIDTAVLYTWMSSGTMTAGLKETGGTQSFTGLSTTVQRRYAHTNQASLTWDKAKINDLRLELQRTAGNVNLLSAYVALVRTMSESGIGADLAVTLDAATLTSKVVLDVIANVALTLDGAVLDSSGSIPTVADLAVTLDDVGFLSTGQVGPGVLGDVGANLGILLDDATLVSTVTLNLVATVVLALDDAALQSVAIVGSLGPFTRRPIINVQ